MNTADPLTQHESSGRIVDVAGVQTFVREEGEGDPALLIHGVPVSSWVWRGVIPALAARGLCAIAPDLPGTGLSGRPESFDYSWTGLGRHLHATVDALELSSFHLVVHDVGGPVGFELAATAADRVRSLTVLDTIVDPHGFRKIWAMRPFEYRGFGELWLRATPRPVFRLLMRRIGLARDTAVTNAEIDVHHHLLRRGDDGRAFLRIMRAFETTPEKSQRYAAVLGHGRPVEVIWARDDPALPAEPMGRRAAALAGLPEPTILPGRHFIQEDQPEPIAERIASLASGSA